VISHKINFTSTQYRGLSSASQVIFIFSKTF